MISEKEMSKPLFFSSRLAMNGEVYSTKCLLEVVVSIKKYHAKEDIAFCTNLASAHYAKRSLEEVNRLKITVVPKTANSPNVAQLRSIDFF